MTNQVVYVPMEGVTSCLSISASTVRNCMKDGRIPAHTYFKVGKNYRFNLQEIISIFRSQENAPQQTETKQAVIEAPKKDLREPEQVQLQFDFDADLDI